MSNGNQANITIAIVTMANVIMARVFIETCIHGKCTYSKHELIATTVIKANLVMKHVILANA